MLVDSPRFTSPLVKRIEQMGGVSLMFLSHRDDIAEGDIVTFSNSRRFVAHRVVSRTSGPDDSRVQTQGDAIPHLDAPVAPADLLGRVSVILRDGRCVQPRKSLRFSERALAAVFRRCEIAARVVVGLHGMRRFAQDSSQF